MIQSEKALMQQAVDELLNCNAERSGKGQDVIAALRQAIAHAKPVKSCDSTPKLHVSDSIFEGWYSKYNCAHKSDKQRAYDAYSAGMGNADEITAKPVCLIPDALDAIAALRQATDIAALSKDAGRWRKLVNASEMTLPVLTIADDPENDCILSYGRKALENLVDACDEISDANIAQQIPAQQAGQKLAYICRGCEGIYWAKVSCDCNTKAAFDSVAVSSIAKSISKKNAPTWRDPTTFIQRFGDSMQALCGGQRPSDDIMMGWLNTEVDDLRLQSFACNHGPVWAQGIGVIDAAEILADQPTEGPDHEYRKDLV